MSTKDYLTIQGGEERARVQHELKTWPEAFEAICRGEKTHEIRKTDRPFMVGDTLLLREWAPAHPGPCEYGINYSCAMCGRAREDAMPGTYTGREITAKVTHVTWGGEWGLSPGLCVMSIRVVPPPLETASPQKIDDLKREAVERRRKADDVDDGERRAAYLERQGIRRDT
jgi:hypothetical protein